MKFLFEVRVKNGYTVQQYADAWLQASATIQRGDGARGTYLHRKIGAPDVVLAIAHWDSKEQRDAQLAGAERAVREALGPHAEACEFSVIGEFEDPEWMIEPRGPQLAQRRA